METYLVKYNQNIYDIAIQIYGSIEGIYMVMKLNPNLSFESTPYLNQDIIYDPEFVVSPEVRDYLSENSINLSNGESNIY